VASASSSPLLVSGYRNSSLNPVAAGVAVTEACVAATACHMAKLTGKSEAKEHQHHCHGPTQDLRTATVSELHPAELF